MVRAGRVQALRGESTAIHDLATGKMYPLMQDPADPDDRARPGECAGHATRSFSTASAGSGSGPTRASGAAGATASTSTRAGSSRSRGSSGASRRSRTRLGRHLRLRRASRRPGLGPRRDDAHGLHRRASSAASTGRRSRSFTSTATSTAGRGTRTTPRSPSPSSPTCRSRTSCPTGDGQLLVFAYSNIYHVDTGLKEWTRDEPLRIRYLAGRPDAVGVYPSIVGDPSPRRPPALRDGRRWLRVDRPTARPRPAPCRASSGSTARWRIAGSAEGTLFSPRDDREPTWRLGAGGWEIADLAPPCELVPDDPVSGTIRQQADVGRDTRDGRPRGTVYTVSATGWRPARRTTARRVGGKVRGPRAERPRSGCLVPCFITPDGGPVERLVRRPDAGSPTADGEGVAALPGGDRWTGEASARATRASRSATTSGSSATPARRGSLLDRDDA